MRRLVTVCSLAMLAVCVSPVPAHAYFWEWLDSLSGPRFGGVIYEVELVCGKTNLAVDLSTLHGVRERLGVEQGSYKGATFSGEAAEYLGRARRYADVAAIPLAAAIAMVEEDRKARRRIDDARERAITEAVLTALAWRTRAAQHFEWGRRLHANETTDPRQQPGSYDGEIGRLDVSIRMVPIGGLRTSRCKYLPLERDNHFLSAGVGVALDIKNDDGHSQGRHLMFTGGFSYHKVIRPWLTLGAGGGLAVFSPSGADGLFAKGYIQPWIVDIKPAAFGGQASLGNAWRHFVFVRYSAITFPQGFDEGEFHPASPRYPKELVHSLGIHFDLAPVIRQRHGNW